MRRTPRRTCRGRAGASARMASCLGRDRLPPVLLGVFSSLGSQGCVTVSASCITISEATSTALTCFLSKLPKSEEDPFSRGGTRRAARQGEVPQLLLSSGVKLWGGGGVGGRPHLSALPLG